MTHTHDPAFGSLRRRAGPLARTLALFAALLVAACSGGEEVDTIDREAFIQTYVDLRMAAFETADQRLTDEARAEVLGRHGVTADELMLFAEVHGRDVETMRDVWNEVELRMDTLRPAGAQR